MHPKEKLPLAYLEHGLKIGSPITGGNSWGVVKRYTPVTRRYTGIIIYEQVHIYSLPCMMVQHITTPTPSPKMVKDPDEAGAVLLPPVNRFKL